MESTCLHLPRPGIISTCYHFGFLKGFCRSQPRFSRSLNCTTSTLPISLALKLSDSFSIVWVLGMELRLSGLECLPTEQSWRPPQHILNIDSGSYVLSQASFLPCLQHPSGFPSTENKVQTSSWPAELKGLAPLYQSVSLFLSLSPPKWACACQSLTPMCSTSLAAGVLYFSCSLHYTDSHNSEDSMLLHCLWPHSDV